ncbi:N-6 DNA methylase [Mycobacteroides abscessus]|uniref:N-6 DNA methylase n=1 Tax=Mycobacteroides abscessus TaxID=36809 RepID=UPI00092A844E|nr:N-6 DNA methylase [Mycobacteroides abscessus]MDM2208047.1 N-6 DNA methylase [Mycobacteroides abscessus]MDM2214672.1 N-6 DNA methylase [Mycobacteroides abscessus]MDM2386892.1 N-6 DNA methylase [Mycobacteroides abscessus]MDM2392160.1 N-6 DNA methylase [Mycobacteroides abscessus]SHV79643.1 Type I restriction-modification system methyltransferase subunit [Mycobacteroides abscessus subsp. abscessus]
MWHPGVNEIEWLADLKPLAQDVGEKVLGYPIRWSVETAAGMSTGRRCDVRIETADGRLLFTGEAKRPDDPKGQHPLVTSEVDGAVAKAQAAGAQYCFTTNFLQIAVLDAGAGLHGQPLRRLQGNTIPMVDPAYADTVGWWKSLTDSERRSAASDGLRMLFERFRDASAGAALPLSVDHVAVDYFRALTDSLLDPLHKAFDSALPSVSPGIHERALRAGLDLSHPQQRRYLIAQGITEVLTAVLFQQVLRGYFTAIEAPLGGMTPQSPQALRQTVISALDEAVHISGDYKPILVVSEIAEWVLGNAPEEAMPHWWELLAFIERLDVDLVTGDILGTIFERLISPERRHDLGQHYTQPRLARAMARWGVREPDDVVLDPACGAGTFLVETYGVHKELGVGHGEALRRTFGNDIDAFAVHLASINLATRRIKRGLNHPLVRHGDAFDLAPENVNMLHVLGAEDTDADDVALTRADLVIANPPYGRSSRNESAYLAHLHGLGMQGLPTTTGINLAAWFVLLGAGLLTERGRMAFVLPSAVLQNENLASWRAWLRRRFDVVIWHTEADVWFSDARVAACVMLMTPAPPPRIRTSTPPRRPAAAWSSSMPSTRSTHPCTTPTGTPRRPARTSPSATSARCRPVRTYSSLEPSPTPCCASVTSSPPKPSTASPAPRWQRGRSWATSSSN